MKPKSPLLNEADVSNLNLLITQHSEWAEMRFPDSTAISSLKGDKRETDECIEAIEDLQKLSADVDPGVFENYLTAVGIEYSDKFLYFLDSIRRFGFTLSDIIGYAHLKLEVNKNREWNKNEDSSYSHIKNDNTEQLQSNSNSHPSVYGC